jgi:2-keto-3-deoxy-L-rhamnonate aldolase RhmA
MKENSIRRAVREGRAALGTGLKEFASRGVPWIIEAAGFDYCAIDHEHGAFDMACGQQNPNPMPGKPSCAPAR